MVDFKKLLTKCRKQLTFPENSMIELPKYCNLPKWHVGSCSSVDNTESDH